MTIDRRSLLALGTLAVLPARAFAADALSAEDQAMVDKAVAYLQGLADAKGRFRQTDARGGVTEGTFYVSRPGRARFEYDPPASLLIVSDGKTVTVANSQLNSSHRYPLDATPLGLFLAKDIRLDRGVKVLGVQRVYDGFSISAQDARGRAQGQIRLDFAEDPLRLMGWAITDPQRRTTTVALTGFGPTHDLPDSLFAGG